jgi:hypothetical protein
MLVVWDFDLDLSIVVVAVLADVGKFYVDVGFRVFPERKSVSKVVKLFQGLVAV